MQFIPTIIISMILAVSFAIKWMKLFPQIFVLDHMQESSTAFQWTQGDA